MLARGTPGRPAGKPGSSTWPRAKRRKRPPRCWPRDNHSYGRSPRVSGAGTAAAICCGSSTDLSPNKRGEATAGRTSERLAGRGIARQRSRGAGNREPRLDASVAEPGWPAARRTMVGTAAPVGRDERRGGGFASPTISRWDHNCWRSELPSRWPTFFPELKPCRRLAGRRPRDVALVNVCERWTRLGRSRDASLIGFHSGWLRGPGSACWESSSSKGAGTPTPNNAFAHRSGSSCGCFVTIDRSCLPTNERLPRPAKW